jgi:hypothetical protein
LLILPLLEKGGATQGWRRIRLRVMLGIMCKITLISIITRQLPNTLPNTD